MLDVAGPLHAFHDANSFGAQYRITVAGASAQMDLAQSLIVTDLAPLPDAGADALVVVPGYDLDRVRPPSKLVSWLRQAASAGAHICAVCTGAFVLGEAGLLNGRKCTTHWKRLDELQRKYPAARVLPDRLFVTDGLVTTSAGVASGIDMALGLIEQHHGPLLTGRVAREMVVYLRRDGSQTQQSVYVDHRTHLSSGIHRVQDHLIGHVNQKVSIAELAEIAHMSVRTLTRTFRLSTGLSIAEYRARLRLETAKALLCNPDTSMESVAEKAGFQDSRHFRRVWKKAFGVSPSISRKRGGS